MHRIHVALAQLRYVTNLREFVQGTGRWDGRTIDVGVALDAVAVCLAVDGRLRSSNAHAPLADFAERFGWPALEAAFRRTALPECAAFVSALSQLDAVKTTVQGRVLTQVALGDLHVDVPAIYQFDAEDVEGALRWAWCARSEEDFLTTIRQALAACLDEDDGVAAFEGFLGAPVDLQKLLFQAIDHGDADRLHALLSAGCDPNQTNDRGRTPLGDALYVVRSHDGPVALVRHLLDAGASPDAPGHADLLIKVASAPTLPDDGVLFEWLLAAGWDPARVSEEGESALGGALANLQKLRKPVPRCGADERDIEVGMAMLERLEADGVVRRLPPVHAMTLVTKAPTPALSERLLAAGAPREIRDGADGVSLLHLYAAQGNHVRLEEALAEGLAPSLRLPTTLAVTPWTVLRAGETPLDAARHARERSRAAIEDCLRSAGAVHGAPRWPAVRIVSTVGADPSDFGRHGTLARRLADTLPKWVTQTPALTGLVAYHAIREAVEQANPFLLAESADPAVVAAFVARLSALGIHATVHGLPTGTP